MSDNTPAICSAVAASFSAIGSITMMVINWMNRAESVRPDLIVEGWSREDDGVGEKDREVIKFARIRNVGKGTAYTVTVSVNMHRSENGFEAFGPGPKRFEAIAANQKFDIDQDIFIEWKIIKSFGMSLKHAPINISIYYFDSRSVRYLTQVRVSAYRRKPEAIGIMDDIGPGLLWESRQTIKHPLWYLKNKERFLGRTARLRRWIARRRSNETNQSL